MPATICFKRCAFPIDMLLPGVKQCWFPNVKVWCNFCMIDNTHCDVSTSLFTIVVQLCIGSDNANAAFSLQIVWVLVVLWLTNRVPVHHRSVICWTSHIGGSLMFTIHVRYSMQCDLTHRRHEQASFSEYTTCVNDAGLSPQFELTLRLARNGAGSLMIQRLTKVEQRQGHLSRPCCSSRQSRQRHFWRPCSCQSRQARCSRC